MGLSHSPSIVTNGLVLCLDAANVKSYPGSGSSMTDISGWRTSSQYKMPMDLALFKVYNKQLTDAEITQNFNAVRGRFGL